MGTAHALAENSENGETEKTAARGIRKAWSARENIARRVRGIPPNPFAAADARVAQAVAEGRPVINLAKGNPDGQPPLFMQEAVAKAAHEPRYDKYSSFDGLPEYLDAIAHWYSHEHGVKLDAGRQILAVAGASVGISEVIQTLVNRGDLVALVGPYYPQYEGSASVVGARLHVIPAQEGNDFLPDLDAVPGEVWDEAKLLVLNYPNNPTGAVATPEFFRTAVRIAREHHVIIMNDFAYAGIGFDSTPPISILSTPGAADVAVELGSLSKMYMVAGWRGGFVAGNADVLGALKTIHQQESILMSTVVQVAGAAGLNSDQSSVRALAATYRDRYLALKAGLAEAGLELAQAHGGLFAWLKAPQGWSDGAFARWLLDETNVAVIPGSDFGPTGRGYVRLSLLEPVETLTEAAQRIEEARGTQW